jgi:hypothetical protein
MHWSEQNSANSMVAREQAAQQELKDDEEPWVEESGQGWEEEQVEQRPEDETTATLEEEKEAPLEDSKRNNQRNNRRNNGGDRNFFVNGLAVGLGIGCIVTFVTMWIAVFFSSQLPPGETYQTMLSIFIYPLIYLLAVGLIALTAGIVREYYVPKAKA